MQQVISIRKSAIKEKLPARKQATAEIPGAKIAERRSYPVRRSQKQKIIAGMPEKSQQKQPAQKKVKKHLPAVSAVMKNRKSKCNRSSAYGNPQ